MTDQTHGMIAAPAAELINLPVSALILSKINPRQEADAEGIAALAASIRAVGLMQNLSGYDRAGNIEIVAGGRRLRALHLLAETGEAPEFVPVRVTADLETAMLWANTENSAREALHPADEIRAYYRMLIDGQSTVAQVASAFAVTEAHVRRRARLGALPDQAIDALKAGKITIGQAQALTIAQDESLILEAVSKISASYAGAYSEHEVRRMVSPESIKGNDRRLKFVGRAAYDAAGGKATVDLFADEAVLHSPEVLDRLLVEKLTEEADKAMEAGWKWAETQTGADVDYQAIAACARLYREEGELTEEQTERYDALLELAQADVLDEAGQEELDALEAILEGDYTSDQRAQAGVLLHVNWRGDLCTTMGLVRAEDIPAAIEAGVLAETTPVPRATTDAEGKAEGAKEKPALSQTLLADLQAMRSAAIQGAILDKPKLALDLLAFSLSERFGPLDMHYTASNITPTEATGFDPDARLSGIEDQDEDEDGDADPFTAFRAKGEKHRNSVLALIVARSLKYAATCYGGAGQPVALFDGIEAEVKANIRQVWTPNAANFFGRVSGGYLENLLADLTGCDRNSAEFKAFAGAKKKEKATILERLFSDAQTQSLWKIDAERKARIDAWAPEEI